MHGFIGPILQSQSSHILKPSRISFIKELTDKVLNVEMHTNLEKRYIHIHTQYFSISAKNSAVSQFANTFPATKPRISFSIALDGSNCEDSALVVRSDVPCSSTLPSGGFCLNK
ncbi:hypothetical protein J1614_000143 [Plenodomus biglobosus]|nr:hypothetical protein J1614_000143 [Plenodomus biglobosus]